MTKKYSLIIIGAGMTGLATGLAWVLNNDPKDKPVLLLEKQPITGGFVTTYSRGGYSFDTCQMISNLSEVFDYFGMKIEMKQFQQTIGKLFIADTQTTDTRCFDLPAGQENFQRHLTNLFPQDAELIRTFLRYSRQMYQEMDALKTVPSFLDLIKILIACPKTVCHASKTFSQYLAKFNIQNPDLLEIFRVFTMMAGLPDHQVAAFLPLGVMFSLLDGAMRPAKSFRELPLQMENHFQALGGELRLKSKVEKIMVEHKQLRGVQLASGERIEAEQVVSAVDTQQAMDGLIGQPVLTLANKKYAKKAKHVSMTASTMNVLLGLDPAWDLSATKLKDGYHVLTSGGNTIANLFKAYEKNETAYSDECFHFSVTLNHTTLDRPTLTISLFPMALGTWMEWRLNDKSRYQKEKKQWANYAIGLVERYLLPGLSSHIKLMDVSTPATYARYSGAASGAIYDMTSGPNNFGLRRLPMQTPFKGLFHPKFAHGVFGSMNSGLQVVDRMMKNKINQGNAQFQKDKAPPKRSMKQGGGL